MIRRVIFEGALCIAVAVGAALWAQALMGSLDTYRSPFRGRTLAPGDAIGSPLTRRLVFVYVDGLRVDTAAAARTMPFLNELRAHAAWATSHSRQPSYSTPGYTTMLSGAWPEFNDGPLLNPDLAHTTPWPQDNLFAAVKRAGLKAALSDDDGGERLVPQDTLVDHFYVHDPYDPGDRARTRAALRWLTQGMDQFVLLHIDQVDEAGHTQGGPRSPNWNAAAHRADILLREIAGALDLTKDTIFITSDHGHIDQGGHGGHERVVVREPWLLAGAGVKPGQYPDTQMVDIAPTLAALLGVSLPSLSQGHVRSDMLQLMPEQQSAIEAASARQQGRWLALYNAATGQGVTAAPGADAVSATQGAVARARSTQAVSERWPRAAISAIAALAILAALWWARGNLVAQSLGALIYLLAFHALYAAVAGRTYSLSSVQSGNDIITACLEFATLSLVLAAATVLWRARALRQGAPQAADAVLGMALVAMAVTTLPVLVGFAWNGAVIDWALPNFPLMFLTFISLLQLAGIGVMAVVLALLAALAGWWSARPAP